MNDIDCSPQALIKNWLPVGRSASAEWKAKWVQFMTEQMATDQKSWLPIRPGQWDYPPASPTPNTGDRDADAKSAHAQGVLLAALQLSDARAESARRLRTTLRAEAWLREIDVCDPRTDRFHAFHARVWGITEPAPLDREKVEEIIDKAVKRVVVR